MEKGEATLRRSEGGEMEEGRELEWHGGGKKGGMKRNLGEDEFRLTEGRKSEVTNGLENEMGRMRKRGKKGRK